VTAGPWREAACYVSLAVFLAGCWLLFQDLADLSQLIVPTNRRRMVVVWRYRHAIAATSLVAGGVSVEAWRSDHSLVPWWLLTLAFAAGSGLAYAGLVNPHLMFRSQQHTARFTGIAEARTRVAPAEEVIVVEVNGDARAFTDRDLLQPHIAHTESVGGEDVVMTYCGLTNLGVAYTPRIGERELDLAVMSQIDNNLIMWDRKTGTPIQQLWGYQENDSSKQRMHEWPTRRMPFSTFCELYPGGRVFSNNIVSARRNPLLAGWDRGVRRAMTAGIRKQRDTDKAAFPTIGFTDTRLPMKTRIYGFNVGDDYVAYTVDFLQSRGGVVNTRVGDEPVVITYDDQRQVLSAYHNDLGSPVTNLDIRGRTPDGHQLPPLETLKAGAYWFIWLHYFPTTDVNRAEQRDEPAPPHRPSPSDPPSPSE